MRTATAASSALSGAVERGDVGLQRGVVGGLGAGRLNRVELRLGVVDRPGDVGDARRFGGRSGGRPGRGGDRDQQRGGEDS